MTPQPSLLPENSLVASRWSLTQSAVCLGEMGANSSRGPALVMMPGQVVLPRRTCSNSGRETGDLRERDVAEVQVGQEATVYVEALNVDVSGRVARISPLASTVGGDVVYTVVIALDEQPQGLRLGMSVEVEIVTE